MSLLKALDPRKTVERRKRGMTLQALHNNLQSRTPHIALINSNRQIRKFISVKPDWFINQVVTLMLTHNVSQVPVMTSQWEVKGMLTWQTIAAISVLQGNGRRHAREFLENHHEVSSDSSLFDAVPTINKYGYVLVRARLDKSVCGIVTSSDLSNEFQDRTEPFLLLSQIEGWLRSIIGQRFSQDVLKTVCHPREVNGVSDMNFGEYRLLLQEPNRWEKLGLNIDRGVFCEQLEGINSIRNDVAHFNFRTRGEDLDSLRGFANFLATLSKIFRKQF